MAEEILLIMSLDCMQQLADVIADNQISIDKSIDRIAIILDAVKLKFNLPGVQCPDAGVHNPDAENIDSVAVTDIVDCSMTEPESVDIVNSSDVEPATPEYVVNCSSVEPAISEIKYDSLDKTTIFKVANDSIVESNLNVADIFDSVNSSDELTELIHCSIATFTVNCSTDEPVVDCKDSIDESETELVNDSIAFETVKGSIDEPTVAFDDPANVNISNDTFMLESSSINDRQTPNPSQMTFNDSLNSSLSCKGGGRFQDS